ncbi:phosphatase 2C [Cordyceps militaris]|uniref:Phosphatase 2C n=1 Tax=Cordyceps militaris TaxID=73501 RepID=A0A2H4SMF5_CORMI|nr:phosphatase 2C [Cordyceps militaris]
MALAEKVPYMEAAMAGSCALLVLYNPKTKTIYTACTGDSRAVLGRQNADGTWQVVPLSEDQTGVNESEAARVQAEHPNEEVVKKGRVLGLGISRSFGNFRLKSTHEDQDEFGMRFLEGGALPKDDIPTPPYIIATPVVTVTKLDDRPAFVVLASDGIWDNCENYEVVDLVVRWLEALPERTLADMGWTLRLTPEMVWWKKEPPPPADYPPGFDFLERWNNVDVRFRQERAVIEDLDNVAVHILRNACGGNHWELLRARLTYRPPFSRYVRDDLTVQVLFF